MFHKWSCLAAISVVLALAGFGSTAFGESRVNTGYFGNVAIKGYDPVAYFTMGEAVQGSKEFSHDWLGATWHFANEEHRQAFADDPVKYTPEYGGYCAFGVAFGELVANIDPEAWSIHSGKLYFQISKPLDQDFTENRDDFIKDADSHWWEIETADKQ